MLLVTGGLNKLRQRAIPDQRGVDYQSYQLLGCESIYVVRWIRNLHLERIAASFFKAEYFVVYHEDTGRMFVSIQWLDFGSSLRENVPNISVYLTLQNARCRI